jgi:aspartyl-tRNA(Asn)/glutamyl-tRNA(Gln) amidotransferase subunit A
MAFCHRRSYDAKISKEVNFAESHMILANFSGFPSMTIPSGFVDTMPVGISITTKAFDEQTMFNVAYAMEEMTLLKGNDAEVDA